MVSPKETCRLRIHQDLKHLNTVIMTKHTNLTTALRLRSIEACLPKRANDKLAALYKNPLGAANGP